MWTVLCSSYFGIMMNMNECCVGRIWLYKLRLCPEILKKMWSIDILPKKYNIIASVTHTENSVNV
jgi:hypothetical protein